MKKESGDETFIRELVASRQQGKKTLKERAAEQVRTAPAMVMHTPPIGVGKTLDECLAAEEYGDSTSFPQDSTPSTDQVAPARPTTYEPSTRSFRDLIQLDVKLIDPNPLAPREVYSPEMVTARANALRTQGQHDPIHVIPHPDIAGRYIIADGWTRVLACLEHEVLTELLAEVHHGMSLLESSWYGYEQNEERQQHCDLDRAMYYQKIIAMTGESDATVARRAKISKSAMANFLAFTKLPEDVLDIIRANPAKFGSNAAAQLAKLHAKCGAQRTVILTQRFVDENQTHRWLVAQVQHKLNPQAHMAVALSHHERFTNGYFKLEGETVKLQLDIEANQLDDFMSALKELIGPVIIPLEKTFASKQDNGDDE